MGENPPANINAYIFIGPETPDSYHVLVEDIEVSPSARHKEVTTTSEMYRGHPLAVLTNVSFSWRSHNRYLFYSGPPKQSGDPSVMEDNVSWTVLRLPIQLTSVDEGGDVILAFCLRQENVFRWPQR